MNPAGEGKIVSVDIAGGDARALADLYPILLILKVRPLK
jgi:hypothetical protein